MTPLPRIDQRLALATGRRLVPAGPQVSNAEAEQVVASLRGHAVHAAEHVRRVSQLDAGHDSEVLVVDRVRWIEANVQSFSGLLADLGTGEPGRRGPARTTGGVTASVQMGVLLSYLATRVLGQFDPFHPGQAPGAGGRLLLVAPNVVRIERDLGVVPEHFRLWVCLHEETHRVQFGHASWLPGHLRTLLGEVLAEADLSDSQLLARLARRATTRETRQTGTPAPPSARGTGAAAGARSGRRTDPADTDGSLVTLLTTPEQRQRIDQLTAVMSLLEGHADVMMDRVGPDVIPTVRTIRARFTRRRQRRGPDLLLRRLLGVEAKAAQYRDGARFVRHVVRRGGLDVLNTVFDSAEALPTLLEIHQPRLWLERTAG
ncbi:zinc-dependent metalloprotease [Auraticoccus monumenti]|uniref:Putative hydrolase/uncharacterized protein, coenzyme F420 biosynthesis associated n=1 Tax=Auraticoccus monumenti TaxID=675864 RepID=A0A1G6RSU1_9ACTN|nr:zinc-dependent metalloprotease [Auraticoccus monumenti]SDD07750.1 putative hydrolase/uncharacterized protein, coenzyme F420 biosynthesis associated [Auraticoccus monumenti]